MQTYTLRIDNEAERDAVYHALMARLGELDEAGDQDSAGPCEMALNWVRCMRVWPCAVELDAALADEVAKAIATEAGWHVEIFHDNQDPVDHANLPHFLAVAARSQLPPAGMPVMN